MVLDSHRRDCFIATVREALSGGLDCPPYYGCILRQIYEKRAVQNASAFSAKKLKKHQGDFGKWRQLH